ncbi:gamma-glutamylcyclotransferase family protein [Polluticaenibacter yanchengensis]|uniref:Gamma-glutamylcyclotransferase n=1 Tax=Polluticaenibacter yanchengensis TaxID=3014562 RepID=A0ABT4UQ68_9BACT|nr:gamma-glutamylcyclotransferase [Chitinophagaceae bacterium LY-5]
MKYFAYGSNMNMNRMRERNINYSSQKSAKLENFKLVFNKKAKDGDYSYANLEVSEGNFVEGIIYEFPDNEITNLDKAEGYPIHYDKIKVTVIDENKDQIEALTYIAQSDKIVTGLLPTSDYLSHLLAGKFFLTPEYFETLQKTKTI